MTQIRQKLSQWYWSWAVLGVAVMWIVVGMIAGSLNVQSLIANVTSASFLGLAALGQMAVITTGRGAIDLSIPNVITLSAFLTMGLVNGKDSNLLLGLISVLLVGLLIGFVNSMLVIYLKITPMIATLAVGYITSSLISVYNRNFKVIAVSGLLSGVMKNRILAVPVIVYIIFLVSLGIYVMFRYTTYGQSLQALGQNKRAAFLAGIPVVKVECGAYMLSSFLAALTGFLLVARVGGAFLGMGDSYMMDTVGSVVIGGTLIAGGRAVTMGTLAGAVFLSLLVTAMQIANFSIGMQNIIKGLLIILVLVLGSGNMKEDGK